MRFVATPLRGAFVVEVEANRDVRGFFARSFCAQEFAAAGLETSFAQCNVSFSLKRGTLRGLHWQKIPHEEVKLVRCTRGAVWDVIVDLRVDSPTLHRWFGVELDQDSRRAIYVPRGFAHGFQTLTDDAEVFYQMSEPYCPDAAQGARYDDPTFAIEWPVSDPIVLARDAVWPLVGAVT